MSASMTYDDTRLRSLIDSLTPEQRYKAARRGIQRMARKVRQAVISAMRSKIKSNKELERAVRSMVYKKKAVGFRVTVGESRGKRSKGYYYSEHSKREVPLGRWLDTGTKPRTTAMGFMSRGVLHAFTNGRKGHSTGTLPRYGFIAEADQQVYAEVTDGLTAEIIKAIEETAKKYGCKV